MDVSIYSYVYVLLIWNMELSAQGYDMTLYSDTELDGFVKLSEYDDYLVENRKSLLLSW
jgi:hypothetical protein